MKPRDFRDISRLLAAHGIHAEVAGYGKHIALRVQKDGRSAVIRTSASGKSSDRPMRVLGDVRRALSERPAR
jgi:hypothetical protein